ncbi:MAG TPA: maleylacetoacetate isomerase [Kofleriaceae bacterium]|nr:maleylacetoacetate isomerase [Kofleriaceae bacterium]
MKLVLHNYWRSSASHRVRIGLALKNLEYEYVAVNIVQGAQRSDEYLRRNPMAQVPTLEIHEDDGNVFAITQSLPILEYLDERFPEVPIMPRDIYLRARTRGLAEIVNSGIQPHQNLMTTSKLKALGYDDASWVHGFISEGLLAFARACAETAGKFCIGDTPTIADCCLVPQLQSARRFKVELEGKEPFAQLLAIEARCLALPAFAAAMPHEQPDAVRN